MIGIGCGDDVARVQLLAQHIGVAHAAGQALLIRAGKGDREPFRLERRLIVCRNLERRAAGRQIIANLAGPALFLQPFGARMILNRIAVQQCAIVMRCLYELQFVEILEPAPGDRRALVAS